MNSGRVIGSSQSPLTIHNTHNRHTPIPPKRDSNPQSQQASGRRPTSETEQSLGPDSSSVTTRKYSS